MASDGGPNGKAPAKAPPKESAAKGAAKGAGGQPPMPYERARDELTELVKRLEAGGLTLEQSLELWERGERLAAICEDWLEGARARLATAMAQRSDGGGEPGTPF
jgi:exodeoxyribonuclease VII small subunit